MKLPLKLMTDDQKFLLFIGQFQCTNYVA